jgi:cation-transporting ATPase 13A3/4/5
VFTVFRLKKQGITCISPKRINIAGDISTIVFDKTGTLTEESVSIHGFRATQKEEEAVGFSKYQINIKELVPKLVDNEKMRN